ncbi:MAG: squalene--hopene cyclase [Thermoguttaceae bacterium]
MTSNVAWRRIWSVAAVFFLALFASGARAEGPWEVTPQSDRALHRGVEWLANRNNQGPEGNWTSNDLGLVSMGALALLSAGHTPGKGPYGEAVARALDYVLRNAKPSGLLNMADAQRDMYNHGLSTFVLGQAYGMSSDQRLGPALDRALKVIAQTQCHDGGWDYRAHLQENGHDLSLAVMQAKALRSAVDSGFEVPPEVIEMAIRGVRQHYQPQGCAKTADEAEQQKHPGQFTYDRSGGQASVAMAAAGVVCLQEFAQYDDWRIEKNMEVIEKALTEATKPANRDRPPLDAYTLYYVGQALYQVGGDRWKRCYPPLRDCLVAAQTSVPDPKQNGMWRSNGRVDGPPGDMYMTSVCCFILAMPNRYLPILQEGKIDSLRQQFRRK